MSKRDLREAERALLLQRCREGEEDCRHNGECGGHVRSLSRTSARVQKRASNLSFGTTPFALQHRELENPALASPISLRLFTRMKSTEGD
jgi:hypothetical protein